MSRTCLLKKSSLSQHARYDTVASAQRAKSQLDGADIYAGCCTLKIEYAKVTRADVM